MQPAGGAPDPVCDKVVSKGRPKEHEHAGRDEPQPASGGANGERWCDGGKHHLVKGKELARDGRRERVGLLAQVGEDAIVKVANEARRGGGREGEGEAKEVPLDGDDGAGEGAELHERERVSRVCQAGVEQAQPGDHDEDHCALSFSR